MYLNQQLYDLLKRQFGDVLIANEGEELVGQYKYDPIYDKTVLDISSRGETFRVCCPYCRESRNRLYINHRYGVFDEITQTNNTFMVRCFNEECFKVDPSLYHDLYNRIFGMLNINQRRSLSYIKGTKPIQAATSLVEAVLPGKVVGIETLSQQHPAIKYLRDTRGYDIQQLVERHKLLFCYLANKEYPMTQHRIIIPLYQENMLVGWQARYPGDIDWKLMRLPKYYNLPSMPKRLILYNYDDAIKQDKVVITEGPTSSWSVWPYGLALLGKQATIQQQRLLAKNFKDKTVIILLDGDAKSDADRLYTQLKPYIPKLVKIDLPYEEDPGCYYNKQDKLWEIINEQANNKGVEINVSS